MSKAPRTWSLSLLAALVALPGCLVFHLERNAPGDVDVHAPPRHIEVERTETPEDPGEHVTRLSLGPYMQAGPAFLHDVRETTPRLEVGAELSLAWYDLEVSHTPNPNAFFGFKHNGLLFIEQPVDQINLAWSFVDVTTPEARIGPLYLEWQRTYLASRPLHGWGVLAGWSLNPYDLSHGPQLGLLGFNGVLFSRLSYRFGEGLSAMFGFTYKLPAAFWVRSR